jgi:protoheme IX farnesyltransferase
MFLGVSGAVSALGHQLKPTTNVLAAALEPATHWMVRLQPLHPLIAVSVGLYLVMLASLTAHLRPDPLVQRAAKAMVSLFFVQCALGLANIFLKAPIPMQMLHLVMADLNFLTLVALNVFALGTAVRRAEPEPVFAAESPATGSLVRAYVDLTKPRVISLLLFTTLTAMVAAKGAWPGTWLFLAVAIGGYMSAGAANAINMVIDRDVDGSMKRTSRRPTVTQQISSRDALVFALILATGSFVLLWSAANLLTALLALSGLVFYVVVYTLLLKRRTWHNIVIGGAAGAVPPLVGWAAVTNDLPPLALYLFAIVFVWTPVHFWALALLLREDYEAAGIPMLPVVKGERVTVQQILLYTAVTVVVTLVPLAMPGVGMIYGAVAVLLNVLLVVYGVQLYRATDRVHASRLFHYSMLYLALLFLGFAIDRSVLSATGLLG